MKLLRVYHPVSHWEECNFNMWGDVDSRADALEKAIKFTSDHEQYGSYMRRVIVEWPISCENSLTDMNLNRRAWLGHAACALYGRIPEDITREAWRHLTDEQQLLANNQASEAIRQWEYSYAKSKGLLHGVGEEMLFEWNSNGGSWEATRDWSSAEL